MLQDGKKAAYAVKKHMNFIAADIGSFVDKPIKRWRTAMALKWYVDAFNPPELPSPVQKIV